MNPRILIPAAVILLWSTTQSRPALSSDDMRPLGVMLLSEICTAQNPAYRDSFIGREFLGLQGGWKAFEEKPLHQCFRRKQWIPDAMCKSVVSVNVDSHIELDRWFYGHVEELQSLDPMLRFAAAAFGDRAASPPCPDLKIEVKATEPADTTKGWIARWPDVEIRAVDSVTAGEYRQFPSLGQALEIVKVSNEVPAVLGAKYGVSFRIDGGDSRGIIQVWYRKVITPTSESKKAAGQPITSRDMEADCMLGQPCAVGFEFDREDELVPGDWHIEFFFRGIKLLDHDFKVVAPRASP